MRNLTEKQQKFLDVLFEEAKGEPSQARKLAGYAENVSTSSIVNALQEQIAERTKKFIATTATGGFKATDKVEVSTSNPLFILPPKDE